jgi:hypothetical protein
MPVGATEGEFAVSKSINLWVSNIILTTLTRRRGGGSTFEVKMLSTETDWRDIDIHLAKKKESGHVPTFSCARAPRFNRNATKKTTEA